MSPHRLSSTFMTHALSFAIAATLTLTAPLALDAADGQPRVAKTWKGIP